MSKCSELNPVKNNITLSSLGECVKLNYANKQTNIVNIIKYFQSQSTPSVLYSYSIAAWHSQYGSTLSTAVPLPSTAAPLPFMSSLVI